MTAPLLKIIGGKSWLAPAVVRAVDRVRWSRYLEPMMGGGAVFFALSDAGAFKDTGRTAILGDADEDLVRLYLQVAYDPEGVASLAADLAATIASADDPAATYRKLRQAWNDAPAERRQAHATLVMRLAAFNGVTRRNKSGKFNVPPRDKLDRLSVPDVEDFVAASAALNEAQAVIVHGTVLDLDERVREHHPPPINEGDLVFVDPPYLATFDKYGPDGFSLDDHAALVALCARWSEAGASVIYCNSDAPGVHMLLDDWPGCVRSRLAAPRRVAASGNRDDAAELIVTSPNLGPITQERKEPMAPRKRKTDAGPAPGNGHGHGGDVGTGTHHAPQVDFPKTTWPALTKLTTNVKGLHAAPLTKSIGPLVAFLGDNWSGKTGHDNALRLAWTGELPSPIGSAGAKLLKLAPAGAEELLALLSSEDGQHTIGLRVPIVKGEAKTPEPIATGAYAALSPEHRHALLPLTSFRAMIRMDSIKAREEFVRRFGDNIKTESPRGMSEAQARLWAETLAQTSTQTGATALAEVAALLRTMQPSVTRQITPLEKQISDLRAEGLGGSEIVTQLDLELQEARAEDTRIAALREARDARALARPTDQSTTIAGFARLKAAAAQAVARITADVERALAEQTSAETELARCQATVKSYADRIDAATTKLTKLPEPVLLPDDRRDLEGVVRIAESVRASGGNACPCCAAPADLTSIVKGYTDAIKAMDEADAQNVKQRVPLQREIADCQAQHRAFSIDVVAAQRRLDGVLQRIGILTASLDSALAEEGRLYAAEASALAEAPATVEPQQVIIVPEPTHRPIEEIERQLGYARAAAGRAEVVAGLEAQVMELKTRRADVEILNRTARSRLTEAMQLVKLNAERAVNAKLTGGFRFVLDLGIDGDECKPSIVGSDGEPHAAGAMTGSDEIALTVALMRAWKSNGLPSIVLLDDAELGPFDDRNFTALLDSLGKAQAAGEIDMVSVACWRSPNLLPPSYKIVMNAPRPRASHTLPELLS